jgi:arylsulfatase A-like enzyme
MPILKIKGQELKMRYQGKESEDLAFTRAALAMVENVDYNVGRIQKAIENMGLAENISVVYFSDNGPNNWRRNGGMRGKKAWVDEGGVRNPFFIRWKDSISQVKKVSTVASSIDLLPTLASLAQIPINTTKTLDGKNLKPLIFGDRKGWKGRLIFNYWNGKTYYTVSQANPGATVQLSFKNARITTKITQVNNSPLKGMEHNRVPRQNPISRL